MLGMGFNLVSFWARTTSTGAWVPSWPRCCNTFGEQHLPAARARTAGRCVRACGDQVLPMSRPSLTARATTASGSRRGGQQLVRIDLPGRVGGPAPALTMTPSDGLAALRRPFGVAWLCLQVLGGIHWRAPSSCGDGACVSFQLPLQLAWAPEHQVAPSLRAISLLSTRFPDALPASRPPRA